MAFYSLIEIQFQTKIKIIRSDNGAEFRMTDFFQAKGIIHQRSCVDTPPTKWKGREKTSTHNEYWSSLNVSIPSSTLILDRLCSHNNLPY
jgi:hypothetical protein